MKKLLVGLILFCLSSNISLGQTDNSTNKPVIPPPMTYNIPLICGDMQIFLDASRDRGEEVFFMGELINNFYTFMSLNSTTQSYLIIVVNKITNFACVVANGVGYKYFMPDLNKKKI